MIVDAHLQQGSGVAAIATILAIQAIPCILVSGDIAEIRGNDARAIVLAKPYSEAGLAAAISRAVARCGNLSAACALSAASRRRHACVPAPVSKETHHAHHLDHVDRRCRAAADGVQHRFGRRQGRELGW
jgi:hypothetical protein